MEKIFEVIRLKQIITESDQEIKRIRSPKDCADIATMFIGDDDREVLLVMCLNTKNEVVGVHRCHVGSLNASIVHPREVFKTAILNNSASIIVSHQHPSQDVFPSQEDIDVTRRLAECGLLLGIELMDHVIVNSSGKYVSLKEKGII